MEQFQQKFVKGFLDLVIGTVPCSQMLSNHRAPTHCVCVNDCYFVVNVLDLLFASPTAIHR